MQDSLLKQLNAAASRITQELPQAKKRNGNAERRGNNGSPHRFEICRDSSSLNGRTRGPQTSEAATRATSRLRRFHHPNNRCGRMIQKIDPPENHKPDGPPRVLIDRRILDQVRRKRQMRGEFIEWAKRNGFERPGEAFATHRETLTVAHINHTPMDCHSENLVAVCSACHLRYDAPMKRLRRITNKRDAVASSGGRGDA